VNLNHIFSIGLLYVVGRMDHIVNVELFAVLVQRN